MNAPELEPKQEVTVGRKEFLETDDLRDVPRDFHDGIAKIVPVVNEDGISVPAF